MIESDRLELQTFTDSSVSALLQLFSNDAPGIKLTSSFPLPPTEEKIKEWYKAKHAETSHTFAIILKSENTIIGAIGFSGNKEAVGMGYMIGEQFRGKGYATEAAKLCINYAKSIGVSKILAETFIENPKSEKVLQKLGFKNIGLSTKNFPARGGDRKINTWELNIK
ncbi:MAG: GNAT family N-acetyltransferase [bacterium]